MTFHIGNSHSVLVTLGKNLSLSYDIPKTFRAIAAATNPSVKQEKAMNTDSTN